MSDTTTSDPVVMYDSDDAAKLVTVKGWVSRTGQFFGIDQGAESAARYSGCTHRKCERCAAVTLKERGGLCRKCRDAKEREKFLAMPEIEYESDMVVQPFGSDDYLFSEEDVEAYADSLDPPATELELIVCEPHHAKEVDPDEFYSDMLPEDTCLDDIDKKLADAFAALNEVIRERKTILSWWPGKTRTTYRMPERDDEP